MSHANHHSHDEVGHIVPESLFLKVLIALLVLTVVTVLAAQVDLGKWNIVGALMIATVKASLVIYFFMHGKYENRIIWAYILIPFILLVASYDRRRLHRRSVPFKAAAGAGYAAVVGLILHQPQSGGRGRAGSCPRSVFIGR